MHLFGSALFLSAMVASASAQIDRAALTAACDDVVAWVQDNINNTDWLDPETTGDGAYLRTEDPKNWVQGAFFVGMKDYTIKTQNADYFEWMRTYGTAQEYGMGSRSYDAEFADIVSYSADDQSVGQYYIALAAQFPDDAAAALEPVKGLLDHIRENPSDVDLDHSIAMSDVDQTLADFGYDYACQPRWCWADALFMGPVTWMDLSTHLSDPVYADFAHAEIRATYDFLFTDFENPNPDNENLDTTALPEGVPGGLFIRDSRYLTEADRREEDGSYVYWARGNGWVFSSLTNILKNVPAGDPNREFYESIFVRMAAALLSLQRPEGEEYAGLWGPSLVNWEDFPVGESSGTAFYVAGFAYGIANGLLSVEEYGAATLLGWNALMDAQITEEDVASDSSFEGKVGAIGQTQMIGADPDEVFADGVQLYSCGGFLQAAANILEMLDSGVSLEGDVSGAPAAAPVAVEATTEDGAAAPGMAPRRRRTTPPSDRQSALAKYLAWVEQE